MDIKEVLSDNLKRLRGRTGKSQSDFAQSIGVPFRTYQNIEGGNSWPELPNLTAIAVGLGVAPADLFRSKPDDLHARRLEVIARLASLQDHEIGRVIPGVESILRGLPKEHVQVRDKNSEGA